jgi:hypothetical protein
MHVWELIKRFMKETEQANNIKFEDSAWQRAKQLERDIQAYIWQYYTDRITDDPIQAMPTAPIEQSPEAELPEVLKVGMRKFKRMKQPASAQADGE